MSEIKALDKLREQVFDDETVKGTVTTYRIHDNDEPDTVYVKVGCGNGTWTIKELRIERCHHVKPRTLEDVLREYGHAYYAHMTDNYMNYDGTDEQVIGKYADEILELLGFEIDEPDTIRNELLSGDAE